jgi:hypothetical protein
VRTGTCCPPRSNAQPPASAKSEERSLSVSGATKMRRSTTRLSCGASRPQRGTDVREPIPEGWISKQTVWACQPDRSFLHAVRMAIAASLGARSPWTPIAGRLRMGQCVLLQGPLLSHRPMVGSIARQSPPERYRPPVEARHWARAALVVRIICHPWASRLAISGPLRAVMPHATFRARQAFRMV